MHYHPENIESKWRKLWEESNLYKVSHKSDKPKFYVLDMFPYPSGAGLHVGHPLGYIASDIYARFKRLQGFNVLHPMGFDSFGLPAEQYAIQTGQHPAITTEDNINTYISQLGRMGFCYDWSREVRTSDPSYYKWTQWIFIQLFHHYYDNTAECAKPISSLVEIFKTNGNVDVNAVCDDDTAMFTAAEWNAMSEKEQQTVLLQYRLTFPNESMVNFCPALGMVLSNDEIKDGVSERGGHPIIQKRMKQWSMRITAYADRLLSGLDGVDWSESLKEQQRNWIGKSVGASVVFTAEHDKNQAIEVFTTRVDTIYGVSFVVLAPEHDLVNAFTTQNQKEEVAKYQAWTSSRSEIDRMSEVKKVTGAFTGGYVLNPLNGERVPVYIADYVLATYGTGAVMGVPSGDQRDWNFATHFQLPIIPILDAQVDMDKQADATKEGHYINSGIINGMTYKEATSRLVEWLESHGCGRGKTQYRMRNAIFSRQRYWGEPVPVYFIDDVPYTLPESELPLLLPDVDKYLPTETGEPPLGRAQDWKYTVDGQEYDYELSTMPGWAGSSFYWYRYMDNTNDEAIASKEAIDYWQDVDLYIGGSEHATGHLLYSRFWNHFLYDLGIAPQKEYAKKLINQGMIQGRSLYLILKTTGRRLFVDVSLADEKDRLYKNVYLPMAAKDNRFEGIDIEKDVDWQKDESGNEYVALKPEIEKMSKRTLNVVNPDDMVASHGADCFRMYEMFLGPIEQSKPWDTKGIEGVQKFLRKFWALYFDEKGLALTDELPTKEELMVLHTAIKKITEDIERFSFNTCVSAFMICVNELQRLECKKREILEPLAILLAPFAPFITEELWSIIGHQTSVHTEKYPVFDARHLVKDTVEYPVCINGKKRDMIELSADMNPKEIEIYVMGLDQVKKYVEGQDVKKVIVVPGRMVNIVV
jgi:leucyl-tRNA synthetase